MERKKSLILVGRVLLILLFMVVSFMVVSPKAEAATTTPGKTLQIGALVCLTGWFSAMDVVGDVETKILADIINESGGITVKGQRYNIEVVAEDCKSTFDGVTAATSRLVYDKGVKFIVGPSAYFGPASVPVCEQNKILHILSFKTMQPGELGPNLPYTFLGHNGTMGISRAGAAAMLKFNPNAKTVCLVTPDDGAIPFLVPLMKEAFSEYGLTMVGDAIGYPNEMVDFSPIAAKVKTRNVDLVFHAPGVPQAMYAIIKALRELGDYRPYGGGVGIRAPDIVKVCGKEKATNVYGSGTVPNHPGNPPQLNELCKRLIAKYGPDAPLFMLHCNPLWVMVQAIKAAQSLDPTVVRNTLEKMTSIDTLYGPGVIGGEKTYGVKNHAVVSPQTILFIENGELKWSGYFKVNVP